MKIFSGQFVNFITWFYLGSFLCSLSTLSFRLFVMRLPFLMSVLKSLWNFVFTTKFYEILIRISSSGIFISIFHLITDFVEMVFTWLPFCEDDWVTAIPKWLKKSRLMSDLRPSATTMNLAAGVCHPLLERPVLIFPSIFFGSFEKVRSCGLTVSRKQIAWELLLTNRVASDGFRMLQALSESTRSVVEILPIVIGMIKGSVFAISMWNVATILSTPLLWSDS